MAPAAATSQAAAKKHDMGLSGAYALPGPPDFPNNGFYPQAKVQKPSFQVLWRSRYLNWEIMSVRVEKTPDSLDEGRALRCAFLGTTNRG